MAGKKASKPVGRPRAFDPRRALDCALQIFWRKGYEGTSLSELTRAMGINRPSLYAAFGDKEALFLKVLDYYAEGPGGHVREALSEPTSRAVVRALLYESVERLTCPQNPGGCLLVQGALACGTEAEPIRKELISRRLAVEAALCQRLKQAKRGGDLPADAKPANLARFIATVIHGMSVQAAAGATRKELRRVADVALRCWPLPRQPARKQLGTHVLAGD